MSILDEIGTTALDRATRTLYAAVLGDDDLSPFFEGMDVTRIEERQRQFLRQAFSAAPAAGAVNLRRAHAPLLRRGLNHFHFDRLLELADEALREAGVSASARRAARARLEQTRGEVMGETYTHYHTKEASMIGRITSMIYAFGCYTLSMGVLVYAAAWLGGFCVPNQLDAPGTGNVVTAVFANLALVLLFGVQHSVMARPAFKAWWTRFVPPQCERATYLLFSGLALFGLMWFWQPIGIEIWNLQGIHGLIAYGLYAAGWFVLVSATFFINHFDLFGLRQAWLHLRGKPYTHIPFRTPGYYRWVRHPIYVGWLMLFWATPTMTVSHLLFALATTGYILTAIPLEERDLSRLLPEYAAYRSRTAALIPGWVRRRTVRPASV